MSVCAVLSCASSLSSCACEMTFPCASTAERFAVRSARSRRASADASCARSTLASSSTSTWPSRAMLPDSKRILLTIPGTSLLTSTLLRLGDAADRRQRGLPGLALRHRGADRLGRRPHLLHLLAHADERADLRPLDPAQQDDEQQETAHDDENAKQPAVLAHIPDPFCGGVVGTGTR